MLNDFTGASHIYIACGYTDMRMGIDGLAGIVEREFHLDLFSDSLFLFCGGRRDRIKGAKTGAAVTGQAYCTKLFMIERSV